MTRNACNAYVAILATMPLSVLIGVATGLYWIPMYAFVAVLFVLFFYLSLWIDRSMEEGKTAKITGPMDAEARARQSITDRNPSVRQILFKRTSKEGGFWLLKGEASLKRLRLFKVRKSFRLKIRVEDGELISYEERKY